MSYGRSARSLSLAELDKYKFKFKFKYKYNMGGLSLGEIDKQKVLLVKRCEVSEVVFIFTQD